MSRAALIQSLRAMARGEHDDLSIGDDAADEIEALFAESSNMQDALRRNGFVQCDIPACNCGSWHARYGLPERMKEIMRDLEEAGHPLCNENGNLVSGALRSLVAERDTLRASHTTGSGLS